jgi:putative endonuclease
MLNNREKGNHGEQLAEGFLTGAGYRILARNFRSSSGEIDIVASTGDTVVFVEVKYRLSLSRGYPAESVTALKQRRIRKTAEYFIYKSRLPTNNFRFDVIQIIDDGTSPVIEHIENAF